MITVLFSGVLTTGFAWVWLSGLYGPVPLAATLAAFLLGSVAIMFGAARSASSGGGRSVGFRLLAGVLAIQLLALPGLVWLEGITHDPLSIDGLLRWTWSLIGIESRIGSDGLNLQSNAHVIPFRVTSDKLGLTGMSLFVAGALVWSFRGGRSGRDVLAGSVGLILLVCVYAWLRLTVLAALLLDHPDPRNLRLEGPHDGSMRMFFDPVWQWVSWLPAAGLCWLMPGLRSRRLQAEPRAWSWKASFAAASFCVAGFALLGAVQHQDPGTMKAGRIVLDDVHSSNWAAAQGELTRNEFGRATVYNYVTLRTLLEHYYDVRLNAGAAVDRGSLRETDVLVLKTPMVPFADAEMDAIEEFVVEGGGLLLVGDHTNLLGMTTNMNPLARRFGMEFNADACNQLHDGRFHRFSSSRWFPHAASHHVENLEFMTSCTLSITSDAEPVVLTTNCFSDAVNYRAPSFFGNVIPDSEDSMGAHVVAAARKIGKGRVILFGDSTIFSSFGVLQEGRRELLLGMIDYLNRAGAEGYAGNRWFAAVALLALLVGLIAARSHGGFLELLTLTAPLALLAGGLAGTQYFHWRISVEYAMPQQVRAFQTIAFCQERGRMLLPPALAPTLVADEVSFDTLFVATQRLGMFPRVARMQDAYEDDAIVLINPDYLPTEHELERLQQYVQGGGRLLLMDSVFNVDSVVNEYLTPFGMHVGRAVLNEGNAASKYVSSDIVVGPDVALPTLAVAGGDPFFATEQGHILMTRKQVGAGVIVVAVDAAMFSRSGLGRPEDDLVDGDPRRGRYQSAFALFEQALFGSPSFRWLIQDGGSAAGASK